MVQRLFFDLDGVLADYKKGLAKNQRPDQPLFFRNLEPVEGAIEAVKRLAERFDVYILTRGPWDHPIAWGEKVEWVEQWLGEPFKHRVIICSHKWVVNGDYLVDDKLENQQLFEGEFIWFRHSWTDVEAYLTYGQTRLQREFRLIYLGGDVFCFIKRTKPMPVSSISIRKQVGRFVFCCPEWEEFYTDKWFLNEGQLERRCQEIKKAWS